MIQFLFFRELMYQRRSPPKYSHSPPPPPVPH
ncbi:hypothetical protein Y048_5984 [Burkholderia pseudomallei MSHR456]|nr:hypothetical protein Y048_5984 [Burkholderia pseudomallei MSHR456]